MHYGIRLDETRRPGACLSSSVTSKPLHSL